eukprot:5795207-Karenia_brevis.AAC.1
MLPLLKVLTRDAAKLFLGSVWTLEAKACVFSTTSWAEGFPSDPEYLKRFSPSVRKWLKSPENKPLLVDAIVDAYSKHQSGSQSKEKP